MADIRTDTAFAVRMAGAADAEGFPPERAWETAPPVCFTADWQGKNADRQRETQVRLLWNVEFLFLRFDAQYRSITVFADAEPSCSRPVVRGARIKKLKWHQMDSGLTLISLRGKSAACKAACGDALISMSRRNSGMRFWRCR